MSKRLTISQKDVVGVKKLVPYETIIKIAAQQRVGKNNRIVQYTKPIKSDCDITHEVHLSSTCLSRSMLNISSPDQDVAILFSLGSGKLIGRPSNSRLLAYRHSIYSVLTWSDIDNTVVKSSGLFRIRDNSLVLFLRKLSDEEQTIVIDSIEGGLI